MSLNLIRRRQSPVLVVAPRSSSPRSISFGSDVRAGDLLLMTAAYYFDATWTVTDSQENTWALIATETEHFQPAGVQLWYAIAGSTGPCTVTLTPSGTIDLTWSIHDYVGVNLSTPIRSSSSNYSGSATTTIQSGSVTATALDLVFAVVGWGSGANYDTLTVGSPFTDQVPQRLYGGSAEGLATAADQAAAGGGEQATWTPSPAIATTYAALIAAIEPVPITSDYILQAPLPAEVLPGLPLSGFTVTLAPGVNPGSVTITPAVSGATGTCSPSTIDLDNTTRSGTFSVTLDSNTPDETIATISVTDSGSLADPDPVTCQAIYSPLASLPAWEAHMVSKGQTYPAGTDYSANTYDQYDAPRVFYNVQDYVTDHPALGSPSDWNDQIAAALQHWRDQMVLPIGGGVSSYYSNAQGFAIDYARTGSDRSRTAAILLRRFTSGGTDDRPISVYWHWTASRDMAWLILNHLSGEDVGYPPVARTHDLAAVAIELLNQYSQTIPRPLWFAVQPYMGGLLCEALIAYWGRYQNHPSCPADIPAAIKTFLDWTWDTCWVGDDTTGAFLYTDVNTTPFQTTTNGTVQASPAPTTTTFAGDSGLQPIDLYYWGGLWGTTVQFTSGALNGRTYTIANYVGATRLFTTSGTMLAAPSSGDTFTITHRLAIAGTIVTVDPVNYNTIFTGDSSLSSTDDYYKYLEITYTSGQRKGDWQGVTGYVGSIKQFTVRADGIPYGVTLAPGDTFLIRHSAGEIGYWNPTPADSPFIGPAYAWYYQYTVRQGARDTLYRLRYDAIFQGGEGVSGIWDNDRAYNIAYRWEMQGLKWRDYGDNPWPAATVLAWSALDPPTGPANGWSGRFRVALSGTDVAVSGPVTLTMADSGAGGTFRPAAPILTTDHPSAVFCYRPAPGASGAITLSVTNDGGLDNPENLTYTVSGSVADATGYTVTGPTGGPVGSPSFPFTLALTPAGSVPAASQDAVGGMVIIVPDNGEYYRDSFLFAGFGFAGGMRIALTNNEPSILFYYTAAGSSTYTLAFTNDSSFSDPASLSYTAPDLTGATTYTLAGPATGLVGVASTNFTLTPDSHFVGTITPADGGAGGAFVPTSLTWSDTSDAKTFTYTPSEVGLQTISATNNGFLEDPASLTYNSVSTGWLLILTSGGTTSIKLG